MRKNKISTVFIVSILALAGIGISYAGFTDYITVYGTVDTATVELEIVDYSCTLVYKIWNCEGVTDPDLPGLIIDIDKEIAIYRGFCDENTQQEIENELEEMICQYELVASAKAEPGSTVNGIDYNVNLVWDNLFPCIDFTADFVFHFIGSIPVKISDISFDFLSGYDFTPYLTWIAYRVENIDGVWMTNYQPIGEGEQLHYCDHIYVEVNIHLPQDNNLQGLTGELNGIIEVKQWNDLCECPLVNADFNYFVNDVTFNASDASSTGNGYTIVSWFWDFGDGVGTSSDSSVSYSYATGGNYSVCLTATNDCGETDTICKVITVIITAEIHGMKWNDLDADGIKDAGEPGMANWTIFLDYDWDGILDPGEPYTYTDINGNYVFTGLTPGNYSVNEVLYSGWTQTYPGGGYYIVYVPLAGVITGLDFGNSMTANG